MGLTTSFGSPAVPARVISNCIYPDRIAEISPPTVNYTLGGDPYDFEKLNQTIAHEIGHSVGLADDIVNNGCPGAVSVMVDQYFPIPNPLQSPTPVTCPWLNIPHVYAPNEHNIFILR
jgi:hypothetical protein